ncbi:hypothetical protein GKA01_09000 [Gluconobacter kanchanaburiensis NBRC 103587]|uniref:Uncharacterized protein n=1 Tax=Gluconobacter kanchanaburiensis NBRC 103587 TaxID=1307948 RepID=A0A511B7N0_9PROT|nr:hypothetical protein AA103587_0633 [Gluconobacter kanchanaburiensis NBRC 103587]GEK95703.1 hypothetical protein GKA01_09000 [Gluconobacter kanchanaburiensis NBRC 103587]
MLVRQKTAQLVCGDGQVFAVADPGLDLIRQARTLRLAYEHVQPVSFKEIADAATELFTKLTANGTHSLVHEVSEKAAHP